MANSCENFIAGKWSPPKSDKRFERENPATGETIGSFPDSGPDDVADAVAAAAEAYPRWRATPAPRRAEILFRAAEMMLARKEELSRDVTIEMGKVLKEARGDVQEAIDMTYFVAGEGRRMFGQVVPSELPNKFAMAVRQPHGVIAAITPWNFPAAIPCWKLMPALIAGNTAVFKPSPYSPLSAFNLVRILEESGLPPGVVNLVFGEDEAGAALVRDPRVAMVSFTGSLEVGREIASYCGAAGKRVHLELGGKNAIIVLDDADVDLAIEGAVWSAFGTSGQRCTAASRMIVHRPRPGRLHAQARLARRLAPPRRRPRRGDGGRPRRQPARAGEDPGLHGDRPQGGRGDRLSAARRAAGERPGPRLLLPAHRLHGRPARHAHRPGGDLRPRDRRHPLLRPRRGGGDQQRRALRARRLHLHARRAAGRSRRWNR